MVWAGLGEKGLRKRDGQIGPVTRNLFPPRGSPLTILAGLEEKGLNSKIICSYSRGYNVMFLISI